MAVDLIGSPGGLFRRIGRIVSTINTVNGSRGSTAPDPAATWGTSGSEVKAVGTATDDIEASYDTLQRLIDGLYGQLSSYRSTHTGFLSYLQTLARDTVIEMVHADKPLPSKSIDLALRELISQMGDSSDTVDANAVAATVAAGGSNQGDGVCTASVLGPDGKAMENCFAEMITVTCTADSQGGATVGRESFAGRGEVAESNPLAYDWPKGSGASVSLTALDAASTSSNLLTNGSFDSITDNAPANWTIAVGAAATDIFAATSSDDYAGGNALKLTGTGGAPLSELYQALSGTNLKPNTVYAWNAFVKKSAGLLAGVLQIDLHDGTSVIDDDAGTANAVALAHGAMSTSYTALSGFFRTPAVLPAAVRVRVKITTALTSGESVFVDHFCLKQPTQSYSGGPYLAIFSGATKFILGDVFTVSVTNGREGELQTAFDKLFGMRALGLQLPSDAAGGETINDSLVS